MFEGLELRRQLRVHAAIIAPCSVKAHGNVGENFRLPRWSQFVTTSSRSDAVNRTRKSDGKRLAFRLTA